MIISEIIKQLNNDLRLSQNLMFNGKKDESGEITKKMMLEIENALTADSSNTQLLAIKAKVLKQKTDLERRGVSFGTATNESETKDATSVKSTNNKLPDGVIRRINFIKKAVEKKDIVFAEENWNEIISMYKGQYNESDAEIIQVKEQIEVLKIEVAETKTKQKELQLEKSADKVKLQESEDKSIAWVMKFNALPYFGYFETDINGLKEQNNNYMTVKSLFEEYKNDVIEKSEDLLNKEKEIQKKLSDFSEEYQKMIDFIINNLINQITHKIEFLNTDLKWKQDSEKKLMPNTLSLSDITVISEDINEIKKCCNSKNQSFNDLDKAFKNLMETNTQLYNVRIERTYMLSHIYNANDADTIIAAAIIILKKSYSDIKILCSKITSNWQEKSSWQSTDSTNTETVYKTTKSIYLQIAAKNNSDKTFLHTVYLAKDKKSDGSWTDFYGNIMYSDEMLEINAK